MSSSCHMLPFHLERTHIIIKFYLPGYFHIKLKCEQTKIKYTIVSLQCCLCASFSVEAKISSLKNCECFNADMIYFLHLLLWMKSTWACVRAHFNFSIAVSVLFHSTSLHFSTKITHFMCQIVINRQFMVQISFKVVTSKFKVKFNSSSLIVNAWNGPITNIYSIHTQTWPCNQMHLTESIGTFSFFLFLSPLIFPIIKSSDVVCIRHWFVCGLNFVCALPNVSAFVCIFVIISFSW